MQFSINVFAVFDSLVEAVRKGCPTQDIRTEEVDTHYLRWLDQQDGDAGWRHTLFHNPVGMERVS